ncbi:hypothetical protein HYH02_015315 [Chlamydomonas schloesseri]|uniref:Uncharacterized protein n=1 Tax=Chlamydomonas schloesseri TaxID=2026947 RepID=A0A835SJF0_9CHLO|nr:hypothetical protein HYH02_015315 [Chlamydomonas schloesseri]|eukprot:KAG2423484.1 hypothetical protein HYH02_015315 [Chlamydomonas schloesseri]
MSLVMFDKQVVALNFKVALGTKRKKVGRARWAATATKVDLAPASVVRAIKDKLVVPPQRLSLADIEIARHSGSPPRPATRTARPTRATYGKANKGKPKLAAKMKGNTNAKGNKDMSSSAHKCNTSAGLMGNTNRKGMPLSADHKHKITVKMNGNTNTKKHRI